MSLMSVCLFVFTLFLEGDFIKIGFVVVYYLVLSHTLYLFTYVMAKLNIQQL